MYRWIKCATERFVFNKTKTHAIIESRGIKANSKEARVLHRFISVVCEIFVRCENGITLCTAVSLINTCVEIKDYADSRIVHTCIFFSLLTAKKNFCNLIDIYFLKASGYKTAIILNEIVYKIVYKVFFMWLIIQIFYHMFDIFF